MCCSSVFSSHVFFFFFFFFFFQAEDGIRDLTVTGVQTCALPILDGGDLRVGNGLGRAAATDEAGDPDDVQDAQPLDEREAGEAVTGKERKGDLLPSVLPATPALDQRQEGLDLPLDELGVDRLLVTGARPQHIPGWGGLGTD